MKSWTVNINFTGEMSAGLWPYRDTVTVSVDSGNPGGDTGEFESFLREVFAEWYPGANVNVEPHDMGLEDANDGV